MAPYFTRRGDDGYTGLLGDERFPKYDPRLETLGTLDEVTAALGMARAVCKLPASRKLMLQVQRDLYNLMAETAATTEMAERFHRIDSRHVGWLEEQVEAIGQAVDVPQGFTVPGDTWAGAVLDLGRVIIRRAERRMAEIYHRGDVKNAELLKYMNRLSSLTYFLELLENQAAGVAEPTLAKMDTDDRNFD